MIKRLRNSLHESFQQFSRSELYSSLKKIGSLKAAKYRITGLLWRKFPNSPPLYGDRIFQNTFILLGKELNVTSFVETGTFMGSTTEFLAQNFPSTPIHSSEVTDDFYKKARERLSTYRNIHLFKGDSTLFLTRLIKETNLGKTPLFFLDAHWFDNWPLEKEVKLISEKLKKALIIIHDFKVPGNHNFKYDTYKDKECSLEMIAPFLAKNSSYKLLFPNYSKETIGKNSYFKDLVGYPIIFQNIDYEFKKILRLPFIQRYFIDGTKYLNLSLRKPKS